MLKEIRTRGDIILFIDEIHTLVGAGAAEGAIDAASILKPMLARGELQLKKVLKEIRTRGDIILFIDEIHTLVGAGAAEGAIDAASILKPMLARGELQTIGATTLDEYRKYVEKDPALERRFQPIQVDEKIAGVRRDKESAIDAQDFERAAHLRASEKQLLAQKGEREKQWKSGDLDVVAEVDDELIAEVLANWTGSTRSPS